MATKKEYYVIQRKKKFFMRYTINGTTKEKLLEGCNDRSQAEALAKAEYKIHELEIKSGISREEEIHDPSILMEEAINKVYVNPDALYYKFRNPAVQQQKTYAGRCKNYLIPFFTGMKHSDVTVETIGKFRTFLDKHEPKLADKTKHEIESLLRFVMKCIPDLDPRIKYYKNPFDSIMVQGIKVNKSANATPAFEVEYVTKLFSVEWKNYFALCMSLIAAYTGMRSNEIACLRKKQFTPEEDYCSINVDSSWSFGERRIKDPKTENGKRKVFIPTWLYKFILPAIEAVPEEHFIFHNSKGTTTPLKGDRYNKALRDAAKEAGFLDEYKEKGYRFYSFRSFFRSYAEKKIGSQTALIRYIMGHSSRDIDEHYFKFLNAHIPVVMSITEDLLPEQAKLFEQKCYLKFIRPKETKE